MVVYMQDRYYTSNPIPIYFFLPHGIDVPIIPIAKLTEQFQFSREGRREREGVVYCSVCILSVPQLTTHEFLSLSHIQSGHCS